MLLVKYTKLDLSEFEDKYRENVRLIVPHIDGGKDWLINFVSEIKQVQKSDLAIVSYFKELILSLNALKIPYTIVYPLNISNEEYLQNKEECDALRGITTDDNSVAIETVQQLELYLASEFSWINIQKDVKSTENTPAIQQVKDVATSARKDLTMQELIDDNTVITEADVRELKSLTNKFKVAMMLQAKSRLNTVLKLCSTLDKLYEALVDRIDASLATTDTASLMYTAEYLSKALNDTNQFIMSLITSEKLQNFFIIDNSSVINISDERVDIDKREKIRKAAEIVIDNIDYFTQGQFDNIVDPNNVEVVGDVSEVKNDADNTTKPV